MRLWGSFCRLARPYPLNHVDVLASPEHTEMTPLRQHEPTFTVTPGVSHNGDGPPVLSEHNEAEYYATVIYLAPGHYALPSIISPPTRVHLREIAPMILRRVGS